MQKVWERKPDFENHEQRQRENYKSNGPCNHCCNTEFWETWDAGWELKDCVDCMDLLLPQLQWSATATSYTILHAEWCAREYRLLQPAVSWKKSRFTTPWSNQSEIIHLNCEMSLWIQSPFRRPLAPVQRGSAERVPMLHHCFPQQGGFPPRPPIQSLTGAKRRASYKLLASGFPWELQPKEVRRASACRDPWPRSNCSGDTPEMWVSTSSPERWCCALSN